MWNKFKKENGEVPYALQINIRKCFTSWHLDTEMYAQWFQTDLIRAAYVNFIVYNHHEEKDIWSLKDWMEDRK